MLKLPLAIFLLCLTLGACGEEQTEADTNEAATDTTVVEVPEEKVDNLTSEVALDHSTWDELLQSNVSEAGVVNYGGIIEQISKLDEYLSMLSSNVPQDSWSDAETMSYWINAYNAYTVKLITENYPLGSIMDLDGGKVWDRTWINIGDKTYSLNNIEHDMLRPVFNDPRIHFAVNCASFSCPPLMNKAFTADNLESSLESLSKTFVNDPERNDLANDKVSQLFNWYADDFKKDGTLIEFLNKYASAPLADDVQLEFLEYNWNLNE